MAGAPIAIGYEWTQEITATYSNSDAAVFPAGAEYRAEVRKSKAHSAIAELTTANGGITRISDSKIQLHVTAAQSALMEEGFVLMDLVRTDQPEPQYTYFVVKVAVVKTITR